MDIYGFKSMLIGLSKQGKIFGFSSYDGQLAWTKNPGNIGRAYNINLIDSGALKS
jgi:hypothetical protein